MQIQPMILIPDAEPPAIDGLPLLRHGQEGVQRAFLHHVMKPVGRAVRQTLDKRILPGQRGKQVLGVRVCHDELRHFDRKFVGKSHHRKEFPLFFRQRINHRSRKDRGNIRIRVRQHTVLGKHPQIQINRRKPALAVIQQRIYLLVGKRGSAPLGIDRQLGMVKPKLRRADLVHLSAQPNKLCRRQEQVTAG